jgi:hypothetical protein
MSHDFLVSLHSSVIEVTDKKPPMIPQNPELLGESKERVIKADDDRHLTIGVSMSPKLRERAANRAKSLGLPFSRYVQWCIEAELDGSSLGDRFKI